MVNEVEAHNPTGEAGASEASASFGFGDPLRSIRIVKWLTRLFVYPGVTALIPLDHAISGLTWQQAISVHLGGFLIATIAIELAFHQVFKLRRHSVYPQIILSELDRSERPEPAAEHGLGVVQRLLRVRASILALRGDDGALNLTAVSGMGREDADRLLLAMTDEAREVMGSRQPVSFKPVGGGAAKTNAIGNERLFLVPVMALHHLVGVLALRSAKGSDELNDRQLLTNVGGALGLSLERLRKELDLRESQERLRTVIASTPIVVFALDRDGTFMFGEGKGLDAIGYKPSDVMGETVFEECRDRPDVLEAVRRAFAGESFATTLQVEGRVLEAWLNPVRDQNGEIDGITGVVTDITERMEAERALQESEAKFRTLTETMATAAFIHQDGRFRYVNSATEALTGHTRRELLTMNFWEVVHPDSRETVKGRGLARQRGQQVLSRYEVKIVTKSGDERWIDVAATASEFEGKPAVLGTALDITERKQAEETIKHLAYHDALTDLPNRALLKEHLTLALAQARRKKGALAVLFLDLDHFKVVNDTVGHGEGDTLLRNVGERLTGLVRECDTVARMGGDEFTLLLSEVARVEDAVEVAERVLAAFRQPWTLQGQEFLVTASIGIALFPNDGEDAETLLRNADMAMYRAKDRGRDGYQLYAPAMNATIAERLAVENSLRNALKRGEFEVHYQPLVNIDSGRIVGTEALVRWQHPERGLVLPAEFIPVAEETGLIVPLGEWVLSTACAQNKAWQEAGLPPMRVAVNLSARQFQQQNLMDMVAQALDSTGMAPRYLQLEITEGVAMQDVDFSIAVLERLRGMGIQIAMDDFGTGYSSLSYLKLLPVNVVKIDRSFVHDLTIDPNDAAIATAVIAMAHNLKLNVIAEGVETAEQLAFLKERRCDEMQGYLFSRPVPADAVETMLAPKRRRAKARVAADPA